MGDRVSTLVMFGATGDLARRMLLPSLYGLDSDGLLPENLRIIGTARTELDDDAFRLRAKEALAEHLPAGFFDPGIAERFLKRLRYVPLDIKNPDGFRAAGRGDRRSVRRGRDLPVDRALAVQADYRRSGGGRPRLPDGANGARKAARDRPSIEPRDQRRGRVRFPRGADVPDRPLSGQGDGPEPARAAVRQSAVRAVVEQRAHRSRPDHGRRDDRCRRPRRLLRRRRRAARHGPEPHAAAGRAGGDGAAVRFRRDRGARRKGQGSARAPSDHGVGLSRR